MLDDDLPALGHRLNLVEVDRAVATLAAEARQPAHRWQPAAPAKADAKADAKAGAKAKKGAKKADKKAKSDAGY